MPPQPCRGLLLDFGSVITRSFFETRPALERALRIPLGSLTWTGPFGNPPDLLWERMLVNELSEREYWDRRAREVGELIGEQWTIQEFCRRYNLLPLPDVLRPETRLLVADAKRAGRKARRRRSSSRWCSAGRSTTRTRWGSRSARCSRMST